MTKSTITDYLQRDNKTLGTLLQKLTKFQQWNTLVRRCLGEESHLMDHCQIVNITSNSLIVIVDSPHWLTRIRFHIPDLLPKLREHPGLQHIKAICCKAQPSLVHTKKPAKKRRQKLAIKPETAAIILETAKKIDDIKLRSILEKIASYTD